MLKEEIHNSYDTIKPDEDTKKRMLQNIQSGKNHSKFIEKETKWLFRSAPVLAVVIIVTTVSCTSYFFSLRDLGLGKEEIQIIILPQQETETGYNNPPKQTTEVDIIALGGVWNSPEYKA
ncbi:MAG: hypothetical protein K2O91_18025, partial [Lachnospiraceae bacterium]|nr:hypothetical protein [Lachnospiraceae bacterium]